MGDIIAALADCSLCCLTMMTGPITSLLLLALACSVLAVQYPCTYTDSSGARYDLSHMYRNARCELSAFRCTDNVYSIKSIRSTMVLVLTRSSQVNYSIAVKESDTVYYVNVCGDTNAGCDPATHSGSCQKAASGQYYSCGDASKMQWNDCMCSRPTLGGVGLMTTHRS